MNAIDFQLELQESKTKYVYNLFQEETLWIDNLREKTLFIHISNYAEITENIIFRVANHIFKKYKQIETIYIGDYFFKRNSKNAIYIGM